MTIDADSPESIVVNFVNELTMGTFFQEKIFPEKMSALYEDFETGNFTKFNWLLAEISHGKSVTQYPYQGLYSARSGIISD